MLLALAASSLSLALAPTEPASTTADETALEAGKPGHFSTACDTSFLYSQRIELLFDGRQEATLVTGVFFDDKCENPAVVVSGKAPFRGLRSASALESFTVRPETVTVTVFDDEMVKSLNQAAACGLSTWKSGVSVQVAGRKDCIEDWKIYSGKPLAIEAKAGHPTIEGTPLFKK